jgi:hypothetical protein
MFAIKKTKMMPIVHVHKGGLRWIQTIDQETLKNVFGDRQILTLSLTV